MVTTKKLFGKMPDGRPVYEYTIENSMGASVSLLTLGGAVRSLVLPDRYGVFKDIACGFDRVEDYLASTGYQGALVGRVCNRISDCKFTLDGKTYELYDNNGGNCLHGGKIGFAFKLWIPVTFENERGAGVKFYLISEDGEENFPGKLEVCVTYTFTEENRLIINYKAETDKPTPVNMTNHTYFNLKGYDNGSVMDYEMFIDSDKYLSVYEDLIPTPEGYIPVEGTDRDFRTIRKIGVPLDDNFLLRNFNGMVKRVAFVCERSEGRSITVYTDTPTLQVYTGCVMKEPQLYKGGLPQVPLHAICLETSFPNNAPNRPDFIQCTLRPGELLDSTTVYEFSTVDE